MEMSRCRWVSEKRVIVASDSESTCCRSGDSSLIVTRNSPLPPDHSFTMAKRGCTAGNELA